MNESDLIRRLRLIGSQPVPNTPPNEEAAQRAQTIAALNAAPAIRPRWRGWALAAAAVVVAGLGAGLAATAEDADVAVSGRVDPTGAVVLKRADSPPSALVDETAVHDGDTIETGPEAHAQLRTSSGVDVDVQVASRVRIESAGPGAGAHHQRFRLDRGSVALTVPKLAEGATLSVVTPHLTVVVHGTKFSVSVTAEATEVAVTEGRVGIVRPEARGSQVVSLGAGGRWRSDQSPRIGTAPSGSVGSPAPSARSIPSASPSHSGVAASPPAVATPPTSTLAAENRLFAAAMRSKRAGDAAGAIRQLDELLRRYPGSPLAVAARSERARLLREKKN